jgi:glycosyltransferase involved in cell wall biosynthesis
LNSDRTPLLSVVIPTSKRPQFLQRAIASALQAAPDGDVELIVVPNGKDDSWKPLATQLGRDSRVQWHPINPEHANVARNHGMALARGLYLRFLDDDDYLHPETASQQLASLISKEADVSTGTIDLADNEGARIGTWGPAPSEQDFAAFCCSPRRMLQVTGHLFRRNAVIDTVWDESLPYSQDICWFLDAVSRREFNWARTKSTVGTWVRHTGERISIKASTNHRRSIIADRILRCSDSLFRAKRLTDHRRRAIAEGLWDQIYNSFLYSPSYWLSVAKSAREIDETYKCNISQELGFDLQSPATECNPNHALLIVAPVKILVHFRKLLLWKMRKSKRW